MAMRLGLVMSFLVLGLMFGLERSEGATYSVGDATGWRVPPTTDFYDNWTDNKVFTVGDVLAFNWTGMHDVVPVTEAQYEACTKVNENVLTVSPALVTLSTAGKHAFICTIGSHCSSGQKLEIDVVAASTTPGATPTPTPPTSTTTPPTSGTTSSPPPPPSGSSAASFGPVVALGAVLSILAFSFMS